MCLACTQRYTIFLHLKDAWRHLADGLRLVDVPRDDQARNYGKRLLEVCLVTTQCDNAHKNCERCGPNCHITLALQLTHHILRRIET